MNEEEMVKDIANALLHLGVAFKKHGLTPPKAIVLDNHGDGLALRSLRPSEILQNPANLRWPPGDVCCEIVGTELRKPS